MKRLRKANECNRTEAHNVLDPRLVAAYARGRVLRQKLLAAEGGTISDVEAANKMGVSPTCLNRLYRTGKVLGWKEQGQTAVRFPVWQFQGTKVIPGLSKVILTLNSGCRLDDIGRIAFFLSNFGFLEGRRPLDLLKEGQLDRVLITARGYVQP